MPSAPRFATVGGTVRAGDDAQVIAELRGDLMSVRRIDGAGTFTRGGVRPAVVFATVIAVVVALVAPLGGVPAAHAGPGSRVSGLVWSDTNRDGIRQTTEPVKSGVTVQLPDCANAPDMLAIHRTAVVQATRDLRMVTPPFCCSAVPDYDAPTARRGKKAAAGTHSS